MWLTPSVVPINAAERYYETGVWHLNMTDAAAAAAAAGAVDAAACPGPQTPCEPLDLARLCDSAACSLDSRTLDTSGDDNGFLLLIGV